MENKNTYKYNETWKLELRELLISSFIDGNKDVMLHEEIGNIYLNYAPKTLYKYYAGNDLNIESITPTAIYIGCNALENLENRIYRYCFNNSLPMYKMHKDEKKFKLNSIKIL